jgi:uncharacterized delta-60 repeat protein
MTGLDASFGTDGRVYDADVSGARALAIQGNGRIVVLAGMALVGYDTSGRRDAAFGSAGLVSVAFNNGFQDEAYGLTRQPDDKLLVVGRTRVGSYYHMAIKRFNADGSVDTAFGSAGLVTLDPYAALGADSRSHYAHRALVAPDGRIVIAGIASFYDRAAFEQRLNFAVARLHADGAPDSSFGGDGTATADIAGGDDWAYALGLQPDGRIVLAGRTDTPRSSRVALARFRTEGQLDTGDPRTPEHYGRDGSGYQVVDETPNGASGQDMVMLASGATVVATPISVAHSTLGTVTRFGLVASAVNGPTVLVRETPIGPDSDVPRAIVQDAAGRFIVVGRVSTGAVSDFGVVRYNSDFSLDTGFGTNGVVLADFFGAADDAAAVALQSDGRIVVAGVARNGASNRLGLVRLLP